VIPEGRRSPFREETDQASERSDAGTSILPRLIGIVKRNLSGAKRRKSAASGERGAGKGAAALFLASAHRERGYPKHSVHTERTSSNNIQPDAQLKTKPAT
jgi:hypothetical protein